MCAGEDVAVRADDDAAAGTALHLILAVPRPLGIDHLLGGNDHHAGADHIGHLLGGQVGAGAGRCGDAAVRTVGAACRGGRCHLLDDHLTTAAELCAHKAAGKAHGCGQHQRHRTACDAPAGALLLFAGRLCAGLRLHRLYRRRGAACSAGRLGLCCACLRLRVIVLVGGIHAAAAHIGIAGAAFGSILRGIIIFPLVLVAHVDTSFP